jgi:3-dehydroquinate synthase II
MSDKIMWVRSDHLPTYEQRKKLVTAALEAGLVDIVVRQEDQDLRRLGRFQAIERRGNELFIDDEKVGEMVEINRPEDLAKASALKDRVEFVVIAANDWKVIPLENLIAEFQRSRTEVLAGARDPEEAKLFSQTLEVGVDGIVIEPSDPSKVKDFKISVGGALPDIELVPVKVTRIAPLSMGDRVCVDTCSLMRVGEGMLVGSQSACLFLVQSESMESEYVAARPFRVNAGAVHAYVLGSDGRTKYLSEVRGGDELMAVDTTGKCRPVVVGRAKVEVRPLLILEVEADGRRYSTILQNAETIRLCTPSGPVSVSMLKVGQDVLVKLEAGGRHFGHAIAETIIER